MSEMVERVGADALAEIFKTNVSISEPLRMMMFAAPELMAELRDRVGRAAIAAMREPTEQMLKALNELALCEGYVPEGWRAAIDAALKD